MFGLSPLYFAFLSRISHFYLAFLSRISHFYFAFLSRISHFYLAFNSRFFFLLLLSRISNVPYRLPYIYQCKQERCSYTHALRAYFYQNALHLTRVHCATFYQSALRHEQHEDVTPSSRRLIFRVDSSEKG